MSINIFFFLPSFFNIIDIDMFQLQMRLFLCFFFPFLREWGTSLRVSLNAKTRPTMNPEPIGLLKLRIVHLRIGNLINWTQPEIDKF